MSYPDVVSDGAYRWRRTAVLAVVLLAPFNLRVPNTALTDLGLRLLVIVALLLVGPTAVVGLRRQPRVDWIDITALVWLAAVWVAALASNDIRLGAGGAARLSVAILLIPSIRGVVRSRRDVTDILRALATGVGAAGVLALFIWSFDKEPLLGRAFVGERTFLGPLSRLTKPWGHANLAAMAIGASLATVATLRKQWLGLALAAALTVSLVLTVSRGGLVAAAVAGVAWIILRRHRIDALVVGALVFLAAVTTLLSAAWDIRTDQLGDDAFFGHELTVSPTIQAGGAEHTTSVTVENQSSVIFEREGERRVLISARWLGDDGLIWSEDWWQLPTDLAPGESLTAPLTLSPRVPEGVWQMRWDLLIEDVAYFGQFTGQDPIWSRGEVLRSTPDPNQSPPYVLVERDIRIDRVDAWSVAWQDFASSPLLGVGPHQFGDSVAAERTAAGQLVGAHAHHIVLEPLATWGLLGTVPFAVLGLRAGWRSVRRAWRSRTAEACAIAVGLLAVAAHGTVDWPLAAVTTAIPIATLLGLALAKPVDQP